MSTISPIKIFSQEEYDSISQKNSDLKKTLESSVKIEALKWSTNEDIAKLIYRLNTLSESKWYWELSIVSVTENVKSTVILLTWISEDNLQEILWIK